MSTLLTLLLMIFPPGNIQQGTATVFASVDKYNPNPTLACDTRKKLDDNSLVVAHRTIKCFEQVIICLPRTSRCVTATTLDRGPFGVSRGKYTSIVDLSKRVAKELRFNGMEKVYLFSPNEIKEIPVPKRKQRKSNS